MSTDMAGRGLVAAVVVALAGCTHRPLALDPEAVDPPGGGPAPRLCGGTAPPMGDGAGGGPIGQWTNVTPAGISLVESDFDGENCGVQDVLVDPARPSDLFAFVCHQGVWRSSDYGQSWRKVNGGPGSAAIDAGKPWAEGIDSDRCRDPGTPPTLHSAGSQGGFWRSPDGGVSWTRFALPEDGKPHPQDGYDVEVDPYDGKHLLLGFRDQTGLAESTDGGETWRTVPLAPGMAAGSSWYVFFIDSGEAAETRGTWLAIAEATSAGAGTWRTPDAGASWRKVESNEHPPGGSQIHQRDGLVYMAGVHGSRGPGVYRSTDLGETWTHVSGGSSQATVYGTTSYIYAQPAPSADQASAARAPQPGTSWSAWPLPMADGPKRVAITHDAAHHIIVSGNRLAGLWRFVEP
jgi:hypothetical protein